MRMDIEKELHNCLLLTYTTNCGTATKTFTQRRLATYTESFCVKQKYHQIDLLEVLYSHFLQDDGSLIQSEDDISLQL